MRPLNEIINDPKTHLIDVRTPLEVAEVNIEGAENIPMDQVPGKLAYFQKLQGDIVLFCRSGARSERVMEYLRQNGIDNVTNAGGYSDVKMHLM